jgi:hypothetical protein
MALDVTNTVRNFNTCAKNRVKERSRSSYLKLFPATRPFAHVAIDIFGPLPKTEHRNRFLLVMNDRFSKLKNTVPLRTLTAFVCAHAFCKHCLYSYGAPCTSSRTTALSSRPRFSRHVAASWGWPRSSRPRIPLKPTGRSSGSIERS